jgi:hypothetical protein
MMFKPHTDVGIFHVAPVPRPPAAPSWGATREDGMGMELIDVFFHPQYGEILAHIQYIYNYICMK